MKHAESRRTTLTLPARCLDVAERIARERNLNLSSIVGEALQRGLWEQEQTQRSDAILRHYSKAFAGFSAYELLLLDDIVGEARPAEKGIPNKGRVGNARGRARK